MANRVYLGADYRLRCPVSLKPLEEVPRLTRGMSADTYNAFVAGLEAARRICDNAEVVGTHVRVSIEDLNALREALGRIQTIE